MIVTLATSENWGGEKKNNNNFVAYHDSTS